MQISPLPSTFNTVTQPAGSQPSAVQELRKITMKTNANPQVYEPSMQELDPVAEATQTNEPTDGDDANQPMSPQFAALARQRRALQVKERELADREKAVQNPTPEKDSIPLARLKSDPLSVLLESGVTYEQLTEAILSTQTNPDISNLKSQVKTLEESFDQKLLERDQRAEKQALAEMRREAEQLVVGEEYEMVRGTGSIPDVMSLIERTYRENGDILDVREALQLIEDELFSEAQKMVGFKKVQSQFQPAQPDMQRAVGMRTLTNKDTASVPMSPRARALAAFSGTLKR